MIAAIEKKSTGTTLLSVIKDIQGIQVRDINRTRASGSKTQRFLECQPYTASKRISFTRGARHIDKCINHMTKITANDSHRHDDIADTLADAIKIALIDKLLSFNSQNKDERAAKIMRSSKEYAMARSKLYERD
jgi:predicted phage terminase large subunit-like protein